MDTSGLKIKFAAQLAVDWKIRELLAKSKEQKAFNESSENTIKMFKQVAKSNDLETIIYAEETTFELELENQANSPEEINSIRAGLIQLREGKVMFPLVQDVAELITNGISLQKGIEAAYAIAKISRLGSKQLMIDRLQEEFKSKLVESIIASSEETYIADLAKKSSDILREHAQNINLTKVTKTKLKAYQCIERQSGYELGA